VEGAGRSSERTGGYVGFVGAGDGALVRSALPGRADFRAGRGFAIAAAAPATLTCSPGGEVECRPGSDCDAPPAVRIDPAGPAATLERDAFGLGALYTTAAGGATWFSSDPSLLRQVPGVPAGLDPLALHGYLCLSYVPTPHTLTAGVASLPAGARREVRPGGVVAAAASTWPEAEPLGGELDDAVDELRARMLSCMQRRLGAEREVGVFLSGGLDSSLVAAMLVHLGARVRLYSLDFGPPFDAELPLARRVAAHLGCPFQVVPARPADVGAAMVATAEALTQPFGDPVTVPLWLLGRAAAGQVGAVFNGEGGDQLFGGWAIKPMLAAEMYAGPDYDRAAAYLRTFHRLHGLTDVLYTAAARAAVGSVDETAWVRPALAEGRFSSVLHRLRAANLRLKGAQNIAPRMAQLADAHGLRLRAPFFDHSLAEWTFRLPPTWLLQGACEKYLLKRAAEPYLPAEIVWREKRGMGAPVTSWCLGPLRPELDRWLSPERLRRDGWFGPAAVGRLRRGEDPGGDQRGRRVGEKLWLLLMLQLWCTVHGQALARPEAAQTSPEAGR
jgi:asparagine synthase (glutamine-hydrolysing)